MPQKFVGDLQIGKNVGSVKHFRAVSHLVKLDRENVGRILELRNRKINRDRMAKLRPFADRGVRVAQILGPILFRAIRTL